MSVRGAHHRHPVLPGRRKAVASREAVRRSRGRPRDPHVPAPRGGPRLQLRVQALRDARVARAVRAVQSALPRSLPTRPLPSRLRASHGGLVRAEASGRGLRRDVRGVAHAPLAMAAALQGLARHGQAALRRPRGSQARRHRAGRAAGLHRHHGGRDEHDRGGVLPRPGARERRRSTSPSSTISPISSSAAARACGRRPTSCASTAPGSSTRSSTGRGCAAASCARSSIAWSRPPIASASRCPPARRRPRSSS